MLILHIGDAHQGKKQYGLEARRQDFRDTLAQCYDIAIERKVDAVILPGDIFNSTNVKHDDALHVKQQVARGKLAGIPTLGIDGNHDMTGGDWLEMCGIHDLNRSHTTINGVTFAGIEPCNGDYYARVSERLANVPNCNVFVTHQTFAELCGLERTIGGEMLSAEKLCALLPESVKYLALGDIHDYHAGTFSGKRCVYPGSIDLTAKDENPAKVVALVDTDTWKEEPIMLDIRPHLGLHVDSQASIESLLDMHAATPNALFKITVDSTMESGKAQVNKVVRENGMLAVVEPITPQMAENREAGTNLVEWDRVEHSQSLTMEIVEADETLDPDVKKMLTAVISNRGATTYKVMKEWHEVS